MVYCDPHRSTKLLFVRLVIVFYSLKEQKAFLMEVLTVKGESPSLFSRNVSYIFLPIMISSLNETGILRFRSLSLEHRTQPSATSFLAIRFNSLKSYTVLVP